MKDDESRAGELYADIGKVIARRRADAGLSQASLGQAVGLTRTSISNIEQGRQRMLVHTLVDIATALGTEPRDLLPEVAGLRHARLPLENVSPSERATIEAIVRRVGTTR